MGRSINLHRAKRTKNDEFYTYREDIEKELIHYKEHFKGKVVYCNCDDYSYSNFTKYFKDNFEKLGISKLVSTCYNPTGKGKIEVVSKGQTNRDVLQGNGDFRSEEVVRLLKESDIVVTNPPFSLFREYIAQLMKYDKKFLVIGNMNAITYKEIFPLLKDDKMWIGYTKPKEFVQPDGSSKKIGLVTWFTNLEIQKHNDFLDLRGNYYSPEEYPKYDNYDAINVNRVKDIPCDYDGVMGVPVTFLDKYNPNQFEVLGLTTGRKEFDVLAHPTKYYKNAVQHKTDGSVSNGSKVNTRATIKITSPVGNYYTADNSDGFLKAVYARILICNKNI